MTSESARLSRPTPDAVGPLSPVERGMALITVIMVMMLVSAVMVGFVAAIIADNRSSGLDHDQTQAYAAAHAGLEKLTSDMSALFVTDVSPSATQLTALTATPPVIAGFSYLEPDDTSGYKITWDFSDGSGNPAPDPTIDATISHGAYQGLKGLITPYNIIVTARSAGGAEMRMKRTMQTIAVPVFQFGVFSETDLSFHAGDTFAFGGRVHTNGNLYLAEGTSETLTISDRVTAVGDIVRTNLANGLATTSNSGYYGTVRIPTTIKANPVNNVYRSLARNEGSLVGTIGSAVNGAWTGLSVSTYKSNIRTGPLAADGGTGAKKLDLPLVSAGARPIDLVRRPVQNSDEDTTAPLVFQQRYFATASLRILLSDSAAEIMNLPSIDASAQPVDLNNVQNLYAGAASPALPPLAGSPANPAIIYNTLPANVYKSVNAPLIGGFIKIEMRRQTGGWVDVTAEILGLGIAGRNLATYNPSTALASRWNNPGTGSWVCPEINPNAVIRLQRVRDVPVNTTTGTSTAIRNNIACGYASPGGAAPNVSQLPTDYWPNALYDGREGQRRDGLGGTDIAVGGIISYIELDQGNLKKWLTGATGVSGTQVRNDNGYILYFSDRRNNKSTVAADCTPLATPCETGEYGYEDIVNPASSTGAPNGALDTGEDLNANGRLDVYGATPLAESTGALTPFNLASRPTTTVPATNDALVARANRIVHFRRALKVTNAGIVSGVNSIVSPGLSIASENPVYLQGNYNAIQTSASAEPNVASAIIADAVTMLSSNWNDIRTFTAPSDSTQRPASTTAYRVALVSGKGLAFPQPSGTNASFGSDGGIHNFLRALEDWNTPNAILRYRGSLVSFFISRQGTGTFKCCSADTYVRGARDWSFDDDFKLPSLLPPGTPMFRDINTLTFRQLLRPNQ